LILLDQVISVKITNVTVGDVLGLNLRAPDQRSWFSKIAMPGTLDSDCKLRAKVITSQLPKFARKGRKSLFLRGLNAIP
jgi:hypothetical protein